MRKNAHDKWSAVLVVDDEPDIAESLASLLEIQLDPLHVYQAGSSDEALTILASKRVDVVLVDYRLGGDNGLDLLHSIHVTYPDVPGLLITAFPDVQLFAQAVNRLLVKGLFIKPFQEDELVSKTAELIRLHGGSRRRIPPFTHA